MKNTQSKHTPGPWQIYPMGYEIVGRYWETDTSAGYIPICRMENDPLAEGATAATIANARLISAAPELLEALSRCLSYLADLNGSSWIKGEDAGSKDMRQRAKALQQIAFDKIAKAVQS